MIRDEHSNTASKKSTPEPGFTAAIQKKSGSLLFLRLQELQYSVQLCAHSRGVFGVHNFGGDFIYRVFELFTQSLNRVESFLDSFKNLPHIFFHVFQFSSYVFIERQPFACFPLRSSLFHLFTSFSFFEALVIYWSLS